MAEPNEYLPDAELKQFVTSLEVLLMENTRETAGRYDACRENVRDLYERWVKFPDPRDVAAGNDFMKRERELAKYYLAKDKRDVKLIGLFHAVNFVAACREYSHDFDAETLRELSKSIVNKLDKEYGLIYHLFAKEKRASDLSNYGFQTNVVIEPKGEAYYDREYLPAVCNANAEPTTTVPTDAYQMFVSEFRIPREDYMMEWQKEIYEEKMAQYERSVGGSLGRVLIDGEPSALRLVYAMMALGEGLNQPLPTRVQEAFTKLPASYSLERLKEIASLWRARLDVNMNWTK